MRNFYLVLGAAAALVIGSAAACSTESETGEGGAGGTATGTGTGTGTNTGTATGTGTNTGTATGSTACALCSEYATDPTINSEDLCGYQGTDPDTGALMCDAASSCELLADIQACTCTGDSTAGTGCLDLCETNGCAGDAPSTECEDCVYTACVAEVTACVGDL